MQHRTRRQIRVLLVIGVLAGLGGAVFGIFAVAQSDSPAASYAPAVLRGLWTGLIIAMPLTAWEVFYANGRPGTWIRRLSFLSGLMVRSMVYLFFIILGLWSGAFLFQVGDSIAFGANVESAVQLGFSFVISLGANFVMSIDRLLGQAVFKNFLTGRYHKPRIEQRILLFADLAGSTGLAEELGNLRFHGLLNDVYRDLTGPVIENRGVIHKYVGDEMIVSWPDTPVARGQAIRCSTQMQRALRQAAGRYVETYAIAPMVRIGIHAGEIVVGEMGDVRQEIVYLGDAMNIASRLVDHCRETGRYLLISETVVSDMGPTDDQQDLVPMGLVNIRGRREPVAVYTAEPEGAK